jgi:methyl-accepting chemotaxis protein
MAIPGSKDAGAAHGGFASIFNDRKINTKISIGFACVLAIMAAIGGTAYFAFDKVATSMTEFIRLVDVGTHARDVDRDFLSLRRYVREYALTGDEANLATLETGRKRLGETIAESLEIIKHPERRAKMEQISREFDAYRKGFDRLLPMRREQRKLIAEVIEPMGAKLRADSEQLHMAAASTPGYNETAVFAGLFLRQILTADIDLYRLLSRYDPGTLESAVKAANEAKPTLASLQGAKFDANMKTMADEIRTLADKYHTAYLRVTELSRQLHQLVSIDMPKLADAIAADAQSVKETATTDQNAIRRDTEGLIAATGRLILVFVAGGLAVGVLLGWLIGRAIAKPVVGLVGAMRKLAEGDFSVVLPGLGRKDEVGGMADAVEQFKVKAAEKAQREAEEKAEQDRKMAAERKAALHSLADQFEKAVGGIVETVSSASTELEAAAGTLTKTAETTQNLSTTVAAASEEASVNVQSVASATNEMSSSVTEISRQVQESSRIANEAVSQAQKTDSRINELSQAAGRIGDVVKLITAIAEQTNLLALNATIEAARAGEAGKGFAVVAQEVKALAAQTAKATDEIGTQISGMQAATQDSVAAIKEIGGTIGRIAEIASTIAAAVEEQGAATQEIARNVQQAAQGTTQVANNITEVNRGAAETGSASSQVLSSAQSLSQESNRLKLEVDKFLATVRAA